MEEKSLGLAAWERQSHGMQSAHQHLDLELNYVLSGTMRYLVGGRIVTLPPLRLCLLWGGVPHQMLPSTQVVEALWVTIPLTAVLRWSLPETLIRPLLATGFIADPAPRSTDLEQLRQWVDDLKTPTLGEIVLLELEARLRRLARGLVEPLAEPTATTPSEGTLAAVEAMAHFISQNFQNPIGVTAVAEPAHLHPNYAMTLFRRHVGLTISQYLTLQRIAHAQRLLLTTDMPILEIALESGFSSVSRFYEAFRQQTGNSPRRFRLRMELSEKER
jgi:AraC-like DNA-binding protein